VDVHAERSEIGRFTGRRGHLSSESV
jgi:hypothetical protein